MLGRLDLSRLVASFRGCCHGTTRRQQCTAHKRNLRPRDRAENMYRELAAYNTGLKNEFSEQWHFKNMIHYRYYSTLLSMPKANCWFATLRSERFTDES